MHHLTSKKFAAIALATTMLAGCAEPGSRPGSGVMHGGSTLNKEDIGTAAGALAGGVIGYQFGGGAGQALATVGGALLGGVLGSSVGKSLDNADRAAYDQAAQRALDSGQRQSWRNSDSGNHGTITPSRSYTSADGQRCREYDQDIYIDGKRNSGHGAACRESDGTWQIINS